jgi:hypothetical protein
MNNKWWIEYLKYQNQNINTSIKFSQKSPKLLNIEWELMDGGLDKIIMPKGYYWISSIKLIYTDRVVNFSINHSLDHENFIQGFVTNNFKDIKSYEMAHVKIKNNKKFITAIGPILKDSLMGNPLVSNFYSLKI